MTKDELIELRRERGKQELNIGDKVIAHSASDKPLYDGKVATIIEKGIIGNEVYYGLYIEGEIVDRYSVPNLLNPKTQAIGKTALLAPFYAEDLELVKSTLANEIEAARLESLRLMEQAKNTYKIVYEHPNLKLALSDTYWDAYKAELIKEIAVKLADNNTINDSMIAYHIIGFATQIVDNLKKQEQC